MKETTKILRRKKREWIKHLLRKAESDRTANNAKEFYRSVRFFKKGFTPLSYGIKDKNGHIVVNNEEGLMVWREYLKELLNGDLGNFIEGSHHQQFQNVQPKDEKPSLEEVKKAIQYLKNNKAPGEDGIAAEVIKAEGDILALQIHELILKVWAEETIPSEWSEALVIPIYKKGDKKLCSNYRGISLLNVTYKILSKLISKRLEAYTESIIGELQAGFIKGKSTTDQVFIIK